MQRNRWALVMTLCAVSHLAGYGQDKSLTIMTYNIHHANPPAFKDSIDVDAIAQVIVQQRADLVAVQEVDVRTNRSGKDVDEAAELARKTSMHYYFAKSIDHDGGSYGIVILSKYAIKNPHTHRLPTLEGSGGEPRVLATATIEIEPGRSIVFGCMHLDAQRNDTNRLLQIGAISSILKEEKLPVIIAGDLNAEPSSEVISILDRQLRRTCVEGCGFTIPEDKPTKTIDYIAFSPRAAFKVLEHRVIEQTYASDHLPVVAVVAFQKRK